MFVIMAFGKILASCARGQFFCDVVFIASDNYIVLNKCFKYKYYHIHNLDTILPKQV